MDLTSSVLTSNIIFLSMYCMNIYLYFRTGPWNQTLFLKNLESIPITNMNRAISCHALNMLALCYLPGCIAAYIQLYRGTKYSRFPKILDRWLKMRKYLGLLMLFSACIHVRLLTGVFFLYSRLSNK